MRPVPSNPAGHASRSSRERQLAEEVRRTARSLNDVAVEILGRPSGTRFVAVTLREWLTRAGHTVHALPALHGLRVTSLLQRGPVFCEASDPIREIARRMTEEDVTAVLVRVRDGLAIVTDKDLRAKVVAAGRDSAEPVANIMTTPILTIGADRFAFDAMIDMLETGVHHLPVIERSGTVAGVISSDDLVNLGSRSPFTVRRALSQAPDEDALVQAAGGLPSLFVGLLDAGLTAPEIGRVLALQSDTATARLVDFTIERHGPAPVAWAWLALGSVARRELTLASDQDNALAYDDGGVYLGTQSGSVFALSTRDGKWVEAASQLPPILSVEASS